MTVRIRITAAIRADYRERGAWPRLVAQAGDASGTTQHDISADCARLMLEDARQCRAAGLGGPLKTAYTALAAQLEPLAGPEPRQAPRRARVRRTRAQQP